QSNLHDNDDSAAAGAGHSSSTPGSTHSSSADGGLKRKSGVEMVVVPSAGHSAVSAAAAAAAASAAASLHASGLSINASGARHSSLSMTPRGSLTAGTPLGVVVGPSASAPALAGTGGPGGSLGQHSPAIRRPAAMEAMASPRLIMQHQQQQQAAAAAAAAQIGARPPHCCTACAALPAAAAATLARDCSPTLGGRNSSCSPLAGAATRAARAAHAATGRSRAQEVDRVLRGAVGVGRRGRRHDGRRRTQHLPGYGRGTVVRELGRSSPRPVRLLLLLSAIVVHRGHNAAVDLRPGRHRRHLVLRSGTVGDSNGASPSSSCGSDRPQHLCLLLQTIQLGRRKRLGIRGALVG
ncbi:hypothetical protein PENTCL1PPCAC_10317, partial [Pristionchus entomophagus]